MSIKIMWWSFIVFADVYLLACEYMEYRSKVRFNKAWKRLTKERCL